MNPKCIKHNTHNPDTLYCRFTLLPVCVVPMYGDCCATNWKLGNPNVIFILFNPRTAEPRISYFMYHTFLTVVEQNTVCDYWLKEEILLACECRQIPCSSNVLWIYDQLFHLFINLRFYWQLWKLFHFSLFPSQILIHHPRSIF